MTHRRFIERATAPVRIDRNAGIVYGCKVLGEHSKNRRRYTKRAMREGVRHYENTKCYMNHPRDGKLSDRPIQECVGVFRNAKYREGQGIFADLHVRKSSPLAEEVLEIAETFHDSFGFSHVAEGASHTENGVEVIDEIVSVLSVDFVSEAATTAGLYESTEAAPADIIEPDESRVAAYKAAADFNDAMNLLAELSAAQPGELSDSVVNDVRKLGKDIIGWINSGKSGVENEEIIADECERIVADVCWSLASIHGESGASGVKVTCDRLDQFICRLISGDESEIIADLKARDLAIGAITPADELVTESTRYGNEEFLPFVRKPLPAVELKQFAHRLR